MNSQQFGVIGLSLGQHILLWVQAAPITLPGEAGDQPPWGRFSLLGFVSPWLPAVQQLLVAPQAGLNTQLGGSCLPAPLWLQPQHQSFLLVGTQQGLSHGGIFCHYSLLYLLGVSVCQQHSSLWSNPSWAPLSLCPDILLGFILPQFLLCLAGVSPVFTWCCLPGWEVFSQAKGIASLAPWAVPGDSAHALHTALAGWTRSSCWKSWERSEIFHGLGPLPCLWGHFFLDVPSFTVSYAIALLWRGSWTHSCPVCCVITVVVQAGM